MGLFRRSGNTHLMVSAAVGALTLGANAAWAQTKPITIQPQALASALHDFGAQTGRQIMFTPESAASKMSRGVNGATDEEVALAELLDGTGLTFRREANIFLITGAADPQSGSAAGDGADAGTVQALIVTAQKREENIQDVPIAMSAFTQEDLTRSQVAGGPDLITQVPNMTFTKTNFSSYSIQLRGIGTQAISATTDAAVAVAFNNTPFVRNHFFEQEFYDLQRVEVLRGPQGTLYGRNATAGVVNVISQKPKFTYEAKLSADAGNYNSTRFEGMVNVPLVDDVVALRLAGAWTKRDGYDTNEITGQRIDGRDLWSTRVSLRFTSTDAVDANLIWEHFQENDDRLRSGKQLCRKAVVSEVGGLPVDTQGGGFTGAQAVFSQGCLPSSLYSPDSFQTPNGYAVPYYYPLGAIFLPVRTDNVDPYISQTQSRDLRVIESTINPQYQAKADLGELQLSVDLAKGLTLTSETAYMADSIFSMQDFNRFNTVHGAWATIGPNGLTSPYVTAGILTPEGVFCDPQIGCSDRLVAMDISAAKSRQFSQEFRLASNYEGPFNFSLGANFLRYDDEDKYYVFINSLSLYAAVHNFQRFGLAPHGPQTLDGAACLEDGMRPPNPFGGENVEGCQYIETNGIHNLNDTGHNYFLSRNPYKLISYAVFGEAYYQLADNLKLTAGLRWTVDKKEAPRIPSWVLAGNSVGYPVMEVVRQEWREPTGRLAIDWKPNLSFTDQTLLYASYAHGYKAGGANPPPAGITVRSGFGGVLGESNEIKLAESALKPRTFRPEFVNAYEVGTKNTLLDGKLTLNIASFYYDYKDYQISYIVDRSAVNLNFDAKVWGVELEADWRPLENLRFGLKTGYESTRVGKGERAIDLMDRTAGHPGWVVVRPFPTNASSCILPAYLFVGSGSYKPLGGQSGGNDGPCELTYLRHLDPVTMQPYVPNPIGVDPDGPGPLGPYLYYNLSGDSMYLDQYPGFDPTQPAINNGEGFYKDLSGHELPNAPHWTATLTADYTIPLPNNWLATLHTDLYYQSEAWTRIFNTPGYDKLKAYTNVNLAAIFSNEDSGWKVMAYVKNVMDRDSITGAFLNSDDTGLTTNVFLTEPRLYGLRVTKDFSGGPWWTGGGSSHEGPFPLTVELGGQVQTLDHSVVQSRPGFTDTLPSTLDIVGRAQSHNLDRGDGRSVKVTWQAPGSSWWISGGFKYGKANGSGPLVNATQKTDPVCGAIGFYAVLCTKYPDDPLSSATATLTASVAAKAFEEHEVADFQVGHDFGLGNIGQSSLSAGLRYASFKSGTTIHADGQPDWFIPEGWFLPGYFMPGYEVRHTRHQLDFDTTREFKGAGPTMTWELATRLWGGDTTGRLTLNSGLSVGVLYGKQKNVASGHEIVSHYQMTHVYLPVSNGASTLLDRQDNSLYRPTRSKSVTVPTVSASLGLSYDVGRVKVGTGYSWERYFNALDVGADQRKQADRTIQGPYLKLSVGFGG